MFENESDVEGFEAILDGNDQCRVFAWGQNQGKPAVFSKLGGRVDHGKRKNP